MEEIFLGRGRPRKGDKEKLSLALEKEGGESLLSKKAWSRRKE